MDSGKHNVAITVSCISFIAYALICFLVFPRGVIFWVELGFSITAFLLLGVAIKSSEKQKLVFSFPLYYLAFAYLLVQIITSFVSMSMQQMCEPWCYVVSVILLALYLCAFLATRATTSYIDCLDKDVQQQTSFISRLILELEALQNEAEGEQKAAIAEVINIARYSNLQSCEASKTIEEDVLMCAKKLELAVQENSENAVLGITKQMSERLKQRDRICKAKGQEA